MPTARLRLSVIIPVHNGGEDLRRCLQGLAQSSRPADEIIVVDDGSTDGSNALAAATGARVIATNGGPRGPAFARNRGVEVSSGDVLVFIDADVVVHADTLARMEKVFAETADVSALFGSYDDDPPVRTAASLYKNLLHHHVHQHSQPEAGTFWAGCGAIRRSAFSALGGFDESYRRPSIEDIELGVRLRRGGQRILLCADVQATHLKHWTLASLLRADIFARAVPWTRLILRERKLPADMNLTWRSRLSALAAWGLVGAVLADMILCLRAPTWVWGPSLAGTLAMVFLVGLNADLFAFFTRRGGLAFAVKAAGLHTLYLLYSSLVFAILWAESRLSNRGRTRGQAIP
jgi:glycosyltransferase involved in cell wall biosynthesis